MELRIFKIKVFNRWAAKVQLKKGLQVRLKEKAEDSERYSHNKAIQHAIKVGILFEVQ